MNTVWKNHSSFFCWHKRKKEMLQRRISLRLRKVPWAVTIILPFSLLLTQWRKNNSFCNGLEGGELDKYKLCRSLLK